MQMWCQPFCAQRPAQAQRGWGCVCRRCVCQQTSSLVSWGLTWCSRQRWWWWSSCWSSGPSAGGPFALELVVSADPHPGTWTLPLQIDCIRWVAARLWVFFWGSTCLHTLFPKVWCPGVYLPTGGWGNCQITLHRQENNNRLYSCQPLLGVNLSPVLVNLYFPYAGQGLLFFCWWQQHFEFQQYVW